MAGPSVLEPFLEARAALAGRASARPAGSPGVDACLALSERLDESLRALATPLLEPGVAVVAVGGYGRREQCRHSDVDLMLLFARQPQREIVDGILYPLWDTGVRIGHSVRTVQQVTAAARANVETFTALLDARLVAGDERLFERFLEARRKLVRSRRRWLRAGLRERRRELRAREPWQLQEPDVKTGRGGLRELQTTQWLERADAIAEGREEPALPPTLSSARETLLATRNALHAFEERPNDRLRRDLTAAVAERLGSERATWMRRVSEAMRHIDAAAATLLDDDAPRDRWGWLPWRRSTGAGGPDVAMGALVASGDLDQLLTALHTAAPGPLEPLPRSAWLDRILPEWEALRCQPHIAPFHLHPVDVHSWRVVAEARHAIDVDEDETATPRVAAELGDPRDLLLAALLHDIGKGHEDDHTRRRPGNRGALFGKGRPRRRGDAATRHRRRAPPASCRTSRPAATSPTGGSSARPRSRLEISARWTCSICCRWPTLGRAGRTSGARGRRSSCARSTSAFARSSPTCRRRPPWSDAAARCSTRLRGGSPRRTSRHTSRRCRAATCSRWSPRRSAAISS